MAHIKLSVETREVTGKKVNRLRNEGIIPIIVYGGILDNALALQVSERELARALSAAGAARVIDLEVDRGRSYPVLARVVQRHPTRHSILHVDFLSVRLDQPIQAEIPVTLAGDSPIEDSTEAMLTQITNLLTIEALPDSLPSEIEVDISGLTEVGQMVTAADLTLPENVTLISDPETLLVSVVPPMRAPAVEEVEEPLEGEEEEAVDEVEVEEGGDEPATDDDAS
jgi:large subunit ribosomal protein L25